VAVLAVLALLLTSCGGSKDDDAAQASKSISASVRKAGSTGAAGQLVSFDRTEADCIGDGLVEKIGIDRLQKYGVLDNDLKAGKRITDVAMSATDARAATGVLFDCTDVESKVQRAIGRNADVPTGLRSCIKKTMTEPTLRRVFTQIFRGKSPQKVLTAPITKCALGNQG